MKKFFLFSFFLIIFCFFLFCFHSALAKTLEFSPNVSLGPFKVGSSQRVYGNFSLLKKYIIAVYRFIIGLSAILAVIVIAIGGIIWATAAGNAGQVSKAKGLITGSLFGLVLTLLSYSLLSAVNSDITNLDFQGATVNEIKNKAVAGCKWQVSKCSSDQIDHTSEGAMYCPANGNKTGDEYCCCTNYASLAEEKCAERGDDYVFGGILTGTETQSELDEKCTDLCQQNGGKFVSSDTISFNGSYLCCECMGTIAQQTIEDTGEATKEGVSCSTNSDCNKYYAPLGEEGKYTCWSGGTCHLCLKSGQPCDGWLSCRYQCCSGDFSWHALSSDICK